MVIIPILNPSFQVMTKIYVLIFVTASCSCNIIHKRQSGNHNVYSSSAHLLASSKKDPVIEPYYLATQTTLRQIIPGL